MAEGAGRECASIADTIILDDCRSDKQPVRGAHKKRPTRNDEMEDGADPSGGQWKEAAEDEERSFEPLGGGPPDSKGTLALVSQDVRWLTKQTAL